jgi:hypothetical protein
VLLVPASAVLTASSGEESTFVVEDGKASRRAIETGLVSQGRVEVVNGLRSGESVIVQGGSSLREGAPVRTIGEPSAADATTDSIAGGKSGS